MANDPVERRAALEPWIEALLEARSSSRRERTLLEAALGLGSRAAWLWRVERGHWNPTAAAGEGTALPAENLVRQVLEGHLPESILGGSARKITTGSGPGALALAVFPAALPASSVEALEDGLEALLTLVHTLRKGEEDGPHGPFPRG